MSKEAVFSHLRTDEQLGYTVGMNTYRAWGAQAVVMYARSGVAAADYIDERIEAFVRAHADTLRQQTPEAFETVRAALHSNLNVRDSNLGEQTKRIWSEIEMHSCRFGRTLELQRALRAVTLADVVELYERVLVRPDTRRKLSVWVRAPGEAVWPTPRRAPGADPLAGAELLDDEGLPAWRAARELLPTPTACNTPPPESCPLHSHDTSAGAVGGAAADARNATSTPVTAG